MIGRNAVINGWRKLRADSSGSATLQYAALAALVSCLSIAVTYTANLVASEKLKAIAAALNKVP